MSTTTRTQKSHSPSNKDPIARLSLAVRQLDNLIDRANQLASLPNQPRPLPLPDLTTEKARARSKVHPSEKPE